MSVAQVVKYEVSIREIVGKYDSDDLTYGSQLIVYPSQTAFLVKGGKLCDEFTSGTYTIKAKNIPLLRSIVNTAYGGNTPFPVEVWFVNQVSILDCKWGTITPLQIEDPKYSIIVPIRGYGQYGFRVSNPRRFLERFIGNMSSFSRENLTEYFKGFILSRLTNIISDKFTADNLSIININSHIDLVSEYAKSRLSEMFDDYGIDLLLFNVISINVDDQDQSFIKLKETKDAAARIRIMGREDYQMSRSFNVLEKAAENEGNGAMGAAVGIGAGIGIGGQVGHILSQNLNINPTETPPPLPIEKYYLAIDGKQVGPLNRSSVIAMIESGSICAATLIWKRRLPDWVTISELSEYKVYFDDEAPPPIK